MRNKNFFMIPNRIFSLGLKPKEFTVYCCLIRHSDREKNCCFPCSRNLSCAKSWIKACRKGKRCADRDQQCGYYKRFFIITPFLRPIRTPYFFTLLYHKAERKRRGKIKFRLKRAASWNKKARSARPSGR